MDIATVNQMNLLAMLLGIDAAEITDPPTKDRANELLMTLKLPSGWAPAGHPNVEAVRAEIAAGKAGDRQDAAAEMRIPETGPQNHDGEDETPPSWEELFAQGEIGTADVMFTETRAKIQKDVPLRDRKAFAAKVGAESGAPRTWGDAEVMEACDKFNVEPELSKRGRRTMKALDGQRGGQDAAGGSSAGQGGQGTGQGGDEGQGAAGGSEGDSGAEDGSGGGSEGAEDGSEGSEGDSEGSESGNGSEGSEGEGEGSEGDDSEGESEGDEGEAGSPPPPMMDQEELEDLIRRIANEEIDAREAQASAAAAGLAEEFAKLLAESATPRESFEALEKKVAELEVNAESTQITITVNDEKPKKIDGIFHPVFKKVWRLAMARVNTLLVGPAGCGKSFLGRQLAQAFELDFFFINASEGMSESKLEGYLVPIGDGGKFVYVPVDFVRAFENGGIFMLDEIDAADANVLIVLHAALANGEMALPKRVDNPIAKKHEDFIFIAAANTFGTGANRLYVGRNQLDEATLDRFRAGQVEMDYDRALERKLVSNKDLLRKAHRVRAAAAKAKLRRIVSTRWILDSDKMVGMFPEDETVDGQFKQLVMGWSDDELARVSLKRDGSDA